MKYIALTLLSLVLLSGCSQKEFSDGANGIANDISDGVGRATEVRE